MRILSYVLTLASSRMGTMALMGSLIFSPSASVPIAKSLDRQPCVIKHALKNTSLQMLSTKQEENSDLLIFVADFSSCLLLNLSPVPHGTVCRLFPGNVSCSPRLAADEWSTEKQHACLRSCLWGLTQTWSKSTLRRQVTVSLVRSLFTYASNYTTNNTYHFLFIRLGPVSESEISENWVNLLRFNGNSGFPSSESQFSSLLASRLVPNNPEFCLQTVGRGRSNPN